MAKLESGPGRQAPAIIETLHTTRLQRPAPVDRDATLKASAVAAVETARKERVNGTAAATLLKDPHFLGEHQLLSPAEVGAALGVTARALGIPAEIAGCTLNVLMFHNRGGK